MKTIKNYQYEEAVKRVKKIKGFYRHVMVYIVVNIVLLILKRKTLIFLINEKSIDDHGFINWMNIDIISTPIIWGIGLLIHGLFVYRHKFSFFKGWEERKIREIMNEEDEVERKKWE